MNDPFADDGWDELTRELGVEKSPPAAEFEEEDPALAQESAEDESQSEGDEFDAGLESEGDAPDGADAHGEEPTEPGKKRRRRRRRRKKGPGEGDAVEAAPGEEAVPAAVLEAPEFDENEYEAGPDSESDELVAMPVGEEDTAGEVLRELIATWNVPSWDSIITGLHRPER